MGHFYSEKDEKVKKHECLISTTLNFILHILGVVLSLKYTKLDNSFDVCDYKIRRVNGPNKYNKNLT